MGEAYQSLFVYFNDSATTEIYTLSLHDALPIFVKEWGYFAVVKVNQSLSLDFVTKKEFSSLHYAFKVNDVQFDEILQSIKNENVPFGSGPSSVDDGKINHNYGGRGVYFTDINGHVLEIITKDYVLE